MAIVWRLENKRRAGIYTAAESWGISTKLGNDIDNRHPTPSISIPNWNNLNDRSKYHFGFSCLDDLYAWVDKYHWRKNMSRYGIRLVKYDVPDEYVHFGEGQLCYLDSEAIAIKTWEKEWVVENKFRSLIKVPRK